MVRRKQVQNQCYYADLRAMSTEYFHHSSEGSLLTAQWELPILCLNIMKRPFQQLMLLDEACAKQYTPRSLFTCQFGNHISSHPLKSNLQQVNLPQPPASSYFVPPSQLCPEKFTTYRTHKPFILMLGGRGDRYLGIPLPLV